MDTPNVNDSAQATNQPPQPQTTQPQAHDISPHDKKTAMGVLAYIGPLVIIPYLMEKDDSFVKFHVKQGLVLLSIEVILWVVTMTFWMLMFGMLYSIIHLALVVLSILGIVNVVQKKEQKLPLVGDFARYFTF